MRNLIIIIAILILSIVLIGCTTNSGNNNDAVQRTPTLVQIPDDIGEVSTVVVADNGLVYISTIVQSGNGLSSTPRIFAQNLDETRFNELQNYNAIQLLSDRTGNISVEKMVVDASGNIYILEVGSVETTEGNALIQNLRKLDSTGNEISSFDLESFIHDENIIRILSFEVDSDGNIYLLTTGITGISLFVLDANDDLLFRVEAGDMMLRQLVALSNGSIAAFGQIRTGGGVNLVLVPVDINTEDFSAEINLPDNINPFRIFRGSGGYDAFIMSETDIYGIHFEGNKVTNILNLLSNNLNPNDLKSIYITSDDSVIIFHTGVIVLPGQDVEKTVLTLATLGGWGWRINVRELVNEFNRTNTNYRIEMIDYADFGDGGDLIAGLIRLSTELITGNAPDILFTENMPFTQWAKRGFLVDIYELIDADVRYNRSDFMENVLRATEIDGRLYSIFPNFQVSTIVGNPQVLGVNPGWTIDEFLAIIDDNPQADIPMGMWITRDLFLTNTIKVNMENYINWSTGEVYFDTDEFVKLLEFSVRFPVEVDLTLLEGYPQGFEPGPGDIIAQGRQVMINQNIPSFEAIRALQATFGDIDLVFKGFPSGQCSGNTLVLNTGFSITTQAASTDGAWQFLRMFLDEYYARHFLRIGGGFPINRTAFEGALDDFIQDGDRNSTYFIDKDGNWFNKLPIDADIDDYTVYLPLTDANIEGFLAVMDSLSGVASHHQIILDLVLESAEDFWNGRGSAQNAARIIQNRVSTYVAEQK